MYSFTRIRLNKQSLGERRTQRRLDMKKNDKENQIMVDYKLVGHVKIVISTQRDSWSTNSKRLQTHQPQEMQKT